MELSVPEVGSRIGTTPGAAHKRLGRLGYKPSRYIGVNAMYEVSEKDLEILKQHGIRGRPKAKPQEPAPKKAKASTPKKK